MNRFVNMSLAYVSIIAFPLLGGCAGAQTKVDDTLSNQNVQNGIQLACAVYTGIKAGYDGYAADHKVSDTVTRAVAGADAAVTTICAHPPTSTAELVSKVTQAGVAVINALKQAQQEAAAS